MTQDNHQAIPPSTKKREKNNLLIELTINIFIPSFVLMRLSGDEYLGSKLALVLALFFPLAYGFNDLLNKGKFNAFSIFGLVSTLLTGGIALFELDPKYIAIKEATVPALIGLATLISLKTPYPLVKTFIYNDKIINTTKILNILQARNSEDKFKQLLVKITYILAASFMLSAFLNYVLARIIVVSPAGSEAFNQELAKMALLSYPVIVVPSFLVMMFALYFLFSGIHKLTGLKLEEITSF